MKVHLPGIALFALPLTAVAISEGARDLSFATGLNGVVSIDKGGDLRDSACHLIPLPDGSFVVQVYSSAGPVGSYAVAFERHLPNGEIDPNFGIGGLAEPTVDGSPIDSRCRAAVLRPDGSIVFVGKVGSGSNRMIVLDVTGAVVSATPIDTAAAIVDLELMPDGRLVAAPLTSSDGLLSMYLPNGERDVGFGVAGDATITFDGTSVESVVDVEVAPSGNLFVLLDVAPTAMGSSDFGIAALNASGTLIQGWGDGTGRRRIAFDIASNLDDAPAAIAVDVDGSVVAVGTARSTLLETSAAIARLDAQGQDLLVSPLVFTGNVSDGVSDGALAVAFGKPGEFAVAGWHGVSTNRDSALLRAGNVTNAVSIIDFGAGGDDVAQSVFLQRGSDPVFSGEYRTPSGEYDGSIARVAGATVFLSGFE